MKVLHIIETLGFGGAEFALLNLLPAMQDLGIESYVCVLNKPYDLQEKLENNRVKVVGLAGFKFLKKRQFVNKFCIDKAIDIVHSHLTRSLILSGFLSGSFKRVNSYHNLGYCAQPAIGIKAKLKKTIAAFIARNQVDLHVGVSRAVMVHYKNHYNLNKFITIPNPIKVPNLKMKCNDTIVVPGRLVTEKGHLDLLDVIKGLKNQGFAFSWIFIGGGYLHKVLSGKITQLNLEKTVTITGTLPQEQFLSIIAQSQLVVLPSLYEGFGMAAAEAMMLGKAVVVSDAGGLTEVVNHNLTGLVFAKGNKKQMLEQLKLILNDNALRSRLALAGKKAVFERFSVNKIAVAWHKLYLGLIS
jgi:glycosyltransferase involved in cell wall biosynthesis